LLPPSAEAGQFLDSLDREDGQSNPLHHVSSNTPKTRRHIPEYLNFHKAVRIPDLDSTLF